MVRSQGWARTEHASRYLVQVCRHFAEHVVADWGDGWGLIDFGWGVCRLGVAPETLLLHAQAADEPGLARVEYVVGEHLERFGLAESLRVRWQRADHTDPPSGPGGRVAPARGEHDHRAGGAVVQATLPLVHDQSRHDQAKEYAPQRGPRHPDAPAVGVRDTPDPGQPHPWGLGEQPDEEAVHGYQHHDRGPAVPYRVGENVREE